MTSDGRVAIVTAASRGMGAACARELADLHRLVQGALDAYGRIDGMVNDTGHPEESSYVTGQSMVVDGGLIGSR